MGGRWNRKIGEEGTIKYHITAFGKEGTSHTMLTSFGQEGAIQ